MHKAINGCWFQPKKALSLLLMLAAICLNACSKEDDEKTAENEAAAVSGLALNKVSFAELEGWKNEDFAALIEVFAKNCRQIMKIKNNISLLLHLESELCWHLLLCFNRLFFNKLTMVRC